MAVRYTSTKVFLVDDMEKSTNMKSVGARAVPEARLGCISSVLNLESRSPETFGLLTTGGRFLLTGNACPQHTAHDDFYHRKLRNQGYFIIVDGM